MSTSRSRNRKLVLGLADFVSLGLAGYLGYALLAKGKNKSEQVEDVEREYVAGVEAYDKADYGKAAESFNRAKMLSQKLLQELEKAAEGNAAKAPPPETYGK